MIWRVEIKDKKGVFDASGEGVKKDIFDLGITSVKKAEVTFVYLIEGDLQEIQIQTICEELLVDRITQDYAYYPQAYPPARKMGVNLKTVEIAYNPGVMDPVEESTLKGIRDLGITTAKTVRTAKKYLLYGRVADQELLTIIDKVLSNKLIQHVLTAGAAPTAPPAAGQDVGAAPADFLSSGSEKFDLILVDLLEAGDKKLMALSLKGQLFLNINEMRAIGKHFKKLGRNPTDCELETIAQTWSEHCRHKTFRGLIRYRFLEDGKKKTQVINNLLKSTIMKATKTINKPWCVSVFHDNAGVIKFDDEMNVCFKVETHNHPSALEPFGGANTGVGGVIRDSLGTGLGAKPICNTDVFCFAKPDMPFHRLPAGTLHPKRVMKGVVAGVRDYGNKMGIPTVNGAVLFDDRFVGNPLVFCGNVGLIPKDKVVKKVNAGDLIVVVGGKTGRDGIHGATFSSGELTHESEVVSSGAVQIGNPIEEKKVLDVLLQARDQGLYSAITDCGAGGLSSAIGEMGASLGCRVDLEKVPLKYQGLKYQEVWISESQERMVLSVPPQRIDPFLKIFANENVDATVIGEFTATGRLELFFQGCQVCDLDMEFLHEGLPKIIKDAVWVPRKIKNPRYAPPKNLSAKLHEVLAHYNVASKEWIIRQYDHEVQGTSVIKPLVGVNADGPSDASVLRPRLNSNKGIAVANGINVRFGMIDPFWMAASCIDEAIRQIITVGGTLDKIAILDNFCWGNPDKPDRLGSLVRAAQGCYKAAVGYKVPFISGKDSLYNEYTEKGKSPSGTAKGPSLAIPGTLLISAIGIIEDVTRCVTMDFKKAGNLIYIVGETFAEMGGSIYWDTLGILGDSVPRVNWRRAAPIFAAVSKAVQKGYVKSAHDISEGGLGVALAEMCFGGGLGAEIHLKEVPFKGKEKSDDVLLFCESNSRFVLEVDPQHRKDFERLLKDIAFGIIGKILAKTRLLMYGLDDRICVSANIQDLKHSWQRVLV